MMTGMLRVVYDGEVGLMSPGDFVFLGLALRCELICFRLE